MFSRKRTVATGVSRRSFVGGALGGSPLAAADAGPADAKKRASPNLRLGVLSDVHVSGEKQAPVFGRALEFYRDRKADGVTIAGDAQGERS